MYQDNHCIPNEEAKKVQYQCAYHDLDGCSHLASVGIEGDLTTAVGLRFRRERDITDMAPEELNRDARVDSDDDYNDRDMRN